MKELNLLKGDNIESLKLLEDNSVDSVVTDPPYGLSFMNKKWDHSVPSVEFWKEVYRVLKPGGHVLSFGGTRTYHRMVVNIEDAGFEIRDQVMWIYGSGFPKSLNIGKAYDKKFGNDREVVGEVKQHNIKGDKLNYSTIYDKPEYNNLELTKGSSQYEGLGTALKPANEPICVARKPLSEKTIVDNVIKWGTGGINVDGCRIDIEGEDLQDRINQEKSRRVDNNHNEGFLGSSKIEPNMNVQEGRFPANIIFDESAAEMLDEQSGVSKSNTKSGKVDGKEANVFNDGDKKATGHKDKTYVGDYSDKGGASRFFYVAKVSKKERNLGLDNFEDKIIEGRDEGQDERSVAFKKRPTPTKNLHPTLKPINLMTYLCRLITPPGGVVLDPFMGSGSTGIAARLEGFKFIGMELDEEYFKIAEARIDAYEEYRKLLK